MEKLRLLRCALGQAEAPPWTTALAAMVRLMKTGAQGLDAQETDDLLAHLYEIEQDALSRTGEMTR